MRLLIILLTAAILACGFAPSVAVNDGKFHRVRVELAQSASQRKLRLSWRRGYYAPSE